MSPQIHGGNIYEAARCFDLNEKEILDFSSNVNPLGPSSSAKRAFKRSAPLLNRYPDPDMPGLRAAIAGYFGIKPEQVICGNGSTELIYLIPRAFRPKKVLIPHPTFTEYAPAVEQAGGKVVPFPLNENDGFRAAALEMAFALKGVDMAFLCNPNNPTAQLIPKVEMLEIMKYAHEGGARLVVDEAFMDFTESESVLKEAAQHQRLICLRDFSKFFGMPGIRIGYAVSDRSTVEALNCAKEPWTVSIPAQRAAAAALGDWSYIKKTRKMIAQERQRLLSSLRLLPGVEPFPSYANFIFIKLTSMDAFSLTLALGQQGILIRDCSSFPHLGDRYVRIAVRTRRENDRLVQALREVLIHA